MSSAILVNTGLVSYTAGFWTCHTQGSCPQTNQPAQDGCFTNEVSLTRLKVCSRRA